MLLVSLKKSTKILTENIRALRLERGLTQRGLSERSGVPLSSLRKFEQTGAISLESFLKLAMSLDCLESIIEATQSNKENFSSIDDVLNDETSKKPQRGWRK